MGCIFILQTCKQEKSITLNTHTSSLHKRNGVTFHTALGYKLWLHLRDTERAFNYA